jgi:aryl-alcohol dehydrogenase-like predicted oxidoreductase
VFPFDEGTLTGMLNYDTVFPPGDWRNTYFVPENLKSSVDHANALRPLIPEGMTMAEMALRFYFNPINSRYYIPGMRKLKNVEANNCCVGWKGLPDSLLNELKQHRWDRTPSGMVTIEERERRKRKSALSLSALFLRS